MASSARPTNLPPTQKVSDVIANFQPTKRFGGSSSSKPHSITSIDFDDTGELCLVAQDNDTLNIYNCKEGKHAKELLSQKYGVDIARYSHHSQSIIYASTKVDDAIRYLSAHDNSYLRYFRGHTAPVTNIALSPADDTFISASLDNTMRLWDLRSQHPQGLLKLNSPYLCTYDPTASVIAVACLDAQSVLLYDARQYDKAPFATFDLQQIEAAYSSTGQTASAWTKLEFSNDGRKLLVASMGPVHYVLDAFEGNLLAYCARPQGHTGRAPPAELGTVRSQQQQSGASRAKGHRVGGQGDACFSPEGRYVMGGSGEAGIYVWDLQGGDYSRQSGADKVLRPKCELGSGTRVAKENAVLMYNPRHNLLATADRALVFWVPDHEG